MIGIGICIAFFVGCYSAMKKSLVWGLLTVLCAGYFYGILRANIISPISHFYFDAALAGAYVGAYQTGLWSRVTGPLKTWCLILIVWPCIIALLPFQSPLITLVGLRGNIFFLPVLLLGSLMTNEQMKKFAYGLVALNSVALSFALLEYFWGIERFYPFSAVTILIYMSRDVGEGHYRLPAIFVNAHAFAGSMVATIPMMLGAWMYGTSESAWKRLLLLAGVVLSLIGVLLAATRTNFVVAMCLMVYSFLKSGMAFRQRALIACAGLAAISVMMTNSRMKRFESLTDTEAVAGRISGSVNRSFFEVMTEYPMGNGMGGGGTSVPYFLLSELQRPVSIESEYGRILLEQGLIGFVLWMSFVLYYIAKGFTAGWRGWPEGRRLVWFYNVFGFGTAAIGTGMLTNIPGTYLFLLSAGWVLSSCQPELPLRTTPLRFGRHAEEGFVDMYRT